MEKDNWLVIYTKPQQEIKVSERLNKIGINAFCPCVVEIKQWSDRKKKVIVPIIKSYVFVKIAPEERHKVFEVPGVVRYLFWLGQPAIVYNKEIESLKNSLEKPSTSIKVTNLKPGNKITIKEGPFADKEGTIVKMSNKYISVALEQLGLIVTLTY